MITAQVGLVPSDGNIKGDLVAKVSRSHWCHMVYAITETHCVSAEPGGARIRPISYYPEIVWSDFPMRAAQRRRGVRYARSKVGTPYGWAHYIFAGIALLTRANTPGWLRSYLEADNRLICSTLCDFALQAAGVHVFHDFRPAGAVVPASFGRVFVRKGWTTTP